MTAEPLTDWRTVFARSGAMGVAIAEHPWERTPLGPIEAWSPTLRTSVATCLESRFPILVWWGPELVMIYNDAYRPMLGASKHPAALGSPGAAIWPEIWDQIGPMLHGVLAGEGATWSEDQLLELHRNGFAEECYFTFSYSPIRDDRGISGVFCAVTETTEVVVEQRRRQVLVALGARLVDATTTGEVVERTLEVLRTDRDDVPFVALCVATPDTQVVAGDGDDPAAVCATAVIGADRRGADGGHAPSVGAIVRTDAVPGHPEVAVAPLVEAGSPRATGHLVVGTSARRPWDAGYERFVASVATRVSTALASVRALEAERRARRALQELDAAKSAFFSNASHEMRTPLTLIAGPLRQLLGGSDLAPEHAATLRTIERSTARLRRLVDDLLDFARLEAGGLTPSPQPIDLGRAVREVAASFEPVMTHGGLGFHVATPRRGPHVVADRDMVDRILLNLLSNAFKYTLEGSVEVEVEQDGDEVRMTVADTGVGIAPSELPRLFDRFHRVAGARGRSHEGAGIGLALVHELARLHGGRIEVDSTPGVGSRFTVVLPAPAGPLDAADVDADGAAAAAMAATYADEAWSWTGSGGVTGTASATAPSSDVRELPLVLVVEDNADMRRYVAQVLLPHWRVAVAADAEEALHLVDLLRPDLVVTDVMLPGRDGFELVAELRASPRTARLPVVVLSARAGEEAVLDGLGAGADDYLVKPFSPAELVARVRGRLGSAAATDWRAALRTTIRDGLFLADASGTVVEVNDEWGRITGFGPEGAPYPQPLPWWPADATGDESAALRRAMRELTAGQGGTYELPFRRADGARIWVSITASPLTDPATGRTWFVGTLRDVTAAHHASQRREALSRLVRRLADVDDLPTLRRLADEVLVEVLGHGGAALAVRTADGAPPSAAAGEHASGRRALGADDAAFAALVADVVEDTARRIRRGQIERSVAETLQGVIVSPTTDTDRTAARYLPFDPHLRVGGDWYDVVPLPGGGTGLVVGDCVGLGLGAAAAMGHLRSASRALLLGGGQPAEVLDVLDRFAGAIDGAEIATVLCAVVRDGSITYASAGHLPALVLEHGHARWLDEATTPPLTVVHRARRQATARVGDGATLLLYTDGLVERRGESIDAGLDRLAVALTEAHVTAASLSDLVDRVIDAMVPPDGQHDDVAVVAHRTGD